MWVHCGTDTTTEAGLYGFQEKPLPDFRRVLLAVQLDHGSNLFTKGFDGDLGTMALCAVFDLFADLPGACQPGHCVGVFVGDRGKG